MSNVGVRVVKVGGSLFKFGRLVPALHDWLDRQSTATNVMVAGGGELVDVVRQIGKRFDVRNETAHWLCIDLMSVTARLLHGMFPNARLLTEFASLRSAIESADQQLIVFDARQFLSQIEPNLAGAQLPHDWTVTSDSIAAQLAVALGAPELVLLKSASVANVKLANCVELGMTDETFPSAIQSLSTVRLIDLRSDSFPEAHLV